MSEQGENFENRSGLRIWCGKFSAWLVFLFNVSLAALAFFVIKDQDKNKKEVIEEKSEEVFPVNEKVIVIQGEINSDREQKLRDLNTTPKEAQLQDVTTKTETKTTVPSTATKKSSTKTKTS
jgi:hypothetical protein